MGRNLVDAFQKSAEKFVWRPRGSRESSEFPQHVSKELTRFVGYTLVDKSLDEKHDTLYPSSAFRVKQRESGSQERAISIFGDLRLGVEQDGGSNILVHAEQVRETESGIVELGRTFVVLSVHGRFACPRQGCVLN